MPKIVNESPVHMMSRYVEFREVQQGTTLAPFISALLPIVREYGVTAREDAINLVRTSSGGIDDCVREVIGDPGGPRIVYEAASDPGCGDDTPAEHSILSGFDLLHSQRHYPLSLTISVRDCIHPPSSLLVQVEGDGAEVERVREVLGPVIEACSRT